MTLTVGVLCLQGGFFEHLTLLRRAAQDIQSTTNPSAAFAFVEVRTSAELATCDALIIPGGESTTISLVAGQTDLLEKLRDFVKYASYPSYSLAHTIPSSRKEHREEQMLTSRLEFRRNPPGAHAQVSSSSPSRPTRPRRAARNSSAVSPSASTGTTLVARSSPLHRTSPCPSSHSPKPYPHRRMVVTYRGFRACSSARPSWRRCCQMQQHQRKEMLRGWKCWLRWRGGWIG